MQPLRGKGGNSFQTIPLAGEPATKNYGHWTLEEVGRVKKLKPNEKVGYNEKVCLNSKVGRVKKWSQVKQWV